MQEGHHVTGVHDLVGTEAQDKIRNDCKLTILQSDDHADAKQCLSPRHLPARAPPPLPGQIAPIPSDLVHHRRP
jgi:hypothetical protein